LWRFDQVNIIHPRSPCSFHRHTPVRLFDPVLTSASSRRKLSSSIALLPDPKTKSVVIFSYCWPVCGKGTNNPVVQNNPRTVCHSRFSFKGELIGYGQQSFPNFDIQAFDHFCPTATQGRSALRALVASDMDWSASAPQIVQLEFDEISGQFLDPRLPSTSTDDGELSPGIASWNAANYQLVYTKTRFNKIETVCLGTL
jgi:hypothetical protein